MQVQHTIYDDLTLGFVQAPKHAQRYLTFHKRDTYVTQTTDNGKTRGSLQPPSDD